MLKLTEVSRIGFGCHAVSIASPEHYEAMTYALRSGCNLFDTSANYMHGESEALIAKVLQDNEQYDAFVITKSGYDEREDLDPRLTRDLLHPDFLSTRLALSLSRLQRSSIDGFLLHSPETSLEPTADDSGGDDFYERIKVAFEFLEDHVANGTIRYYGVSSNTFHLTTANPETIRLQRLLSIAENVSSTHHFKLIEFPFNLIEQDALIRHHEGRSLIELARVNALVTIGNRPLNANGPGGALRLALGADYERALEFHDSGDALQESLALIRGQLRRCGLSDNPMEYAIVAFLNDNWTTLGTPDAVREVFTHLHSFLELLYDGGIPIDDFAAFRRLYRTTVAYSRRVMTERTIAFKEALVEKGMIESGDGRALSLIACEGYLNSGLDHVVVGMRKPEYVSILKPLFGSAPRTT